MAKGVAFTLSETDCRMAGEISQRLQTAIRRAQRARVPIPPLSEATTSEAGWLEHATWGVYYNEVVERLRAHKRTTAEYHDVLDASAKELSLPWRGS